RKTNRLPIADCRKWRFALDVRRNPRRGFPTALPRLPLATPSWRPVPFIESGQKDVLSSTRGAGLDAIARFGARHGAIHVGLAAEFLYHRQPERHGTECGWAAGCGNQFRRKIDRLRLAQRR